MLRRALTVGVAAFVLGATGAAGGVTHPTRGNCTLVGTKRADQIRGTSIHDVICALAGADYANGQLGSDTVRGGKDRDTLVGGHGVDAIYGRRRGDNIFAVDGTTGDLIRGGVGNDNCYGDKGDTFSGCEHVAKV